MGDPLAVLALVGPAAADALEHHALRAPAEDAVVIPEYRDHYLWPLLPEGRRPRLPPGFFGDPETLPPRLGAGAPPAGVAAPPPPRGGAPGGASDEAPCAMPSIPITSTPCSCRAIARCCISGSDARAS